MKPGSLRAVVAEDSAIVRVGITTVLDRAGIAVVAAVGDAPDLFAAVAESVPDIVITDIRMPPTRTLEGLEAAERLALEHPDLGILVLSQHIEAGSIAKMLLRKPGGVGYLLKDRISEIDFFIDAVERVARGGTAVDPDVVEMLMRQPRADHLGRISVREREILGLMAEGRSNAAICELLFLSPKTVETHVGNIFMKLGLPVATADHRRVLAVLTYLRSL